MKYLFLILFFSIFLFSVISSSAQKLEGYYVILKREPQVGPKELFHFINDSNFRYQAHSEGLILIGEGVFRKQSDTLVLYFRNCQTCRVDTNTVLKRSTAPKNWIYLKKQMPWGIDVWGVQDEVITYTIHQGKNNQVIFRDKNSVTTYRRLTGKDIDTYKLGFDKYFIE